MVHSPTALVNYTRLPVDAAPPADTRRVISVVALASADERNCACTFYLVFKEPARLASPRRAQFRRQGNLTILLSGLPGVNSFFDAPQVFLEPKDRIEKDEL